MYRSQVKLFLVSNLIIAFLWLMLICISQKAKAEDTVRAKVNSYQIVDPCGDKIDQVLIALDLGKIVKTDSLFGCDFQLSYDTSRLKMHSGLYINTLSEFFEDKNVSFSKSGKITGYVAVASYFSPPVYGTKPLMAFQGNYLTSCKDSIEIKIEYLEFTDEFKRPVIYQSGYVVAEPNVKNDLHIKVYPKVDTSRFNMDTSEIEIYLLCEHKPDSALSRLEFDLKLQKSEKYIIKSVELLSLDVLDAEDLYFTNDSIIARLNVKGKVDKIPLIKFRIAEINRDTSLTSFEINVTKVDECACVTKKITGIGYLKTEEEKQDTTEVVNQFLSQIQQMSYNKLTDEFLISAEKEIKSIEIYSILGEKLYENAENDKRFIAVPAYKWSAGYYIAIVEFLDKKKEQKILIKI